MVVAVAIVAIVAALIVVAALERHVRRFSRVTNHMTQPPLIFLSLPNPPPPSHFDINDSNQPFSFSPMVSLFTFYHANVRHASSTLSRGHDGEYK